MVERVTDDEHVILNADKLDRTRIGKALETIRLAHEGELWPEDVVAEARDAAHPLHKHFQWDDSLAAAQFRLSQARAIIRIVRIEIGEPARLVRAYLSLPRDEGGRSYRTVRDILDSGELRQRLLEQAESELESWTRRYRELKEIVALVEPAQKALRAQKQRRRQAEPIAEARPAT